MCFQAFSSVVNFFLTTENGCQKDKLWIGIQNLTFSEIYAILKVNFGVTKEEGVIFMKLGKKILIVAGVILIIFAILIGRKAWILKNLQRKVSNYTQMTNYYVKIVSHDGQESIYETYKKDDKYLVKFEVLSPNKSKVINYCNGETTNCYIEREESKIAILDTEALPSPAMITDYWSEFSTKEFIKMVLFKITRITSEAYNGKDCYKIQCKDGENTWDMYFEKETGLMAQPEYQFNCVTEEDLVEPDVSEYEIQEKNEKKLD